MNYSRLLPVNMVDRHDDHLAANARFGIHISQGRPDHLAEIYGYFSRRQFTVRPAMTF